MEPRPATVTYVSLARFSMMAPVRARYPSFFHWTDWLRLSTSRQTIMNNPVRHSSTGFRVDVKVSAFAAALP